MTLESTIAVMLFAVMTFVGAIMYSKGRNLAAQEAVKKILEGDALVEKIATVNTEMVKKDVEKLQSSVDQLSLKVTELPKPMTAEEQKKIVQEATIPLFQEHLQVSTKTMRSLLLSKKEQAQMALEEAQQAVQESQEEEPQEEEVVEEEPVEVEPPKPVVRKPFARGTVPSRPSPASFVNVPKKPVGRPPLKRAPTQLDDGMDGQE